MLTNHVINNYAFADHDKTFVSLPRIQHALRRSVAIHPIFLCCGSRFHGSRFSEYFTKTCASVTSLTWEARRIPLWQAECKNRDPLAYISVLRLCWFSVSIFGVFSGDVRFYYSHLPTDSPSSLNMFLSVD